MPKVKEKESTIQKAVLDWLKYNNLLAVRLNNIDAHVDYPFLGVPISVWIEFKTSTGKLSEHQKNFKDKVESYGGFYCIVRSIDDMESSLDDVKKEVESRIKNLQ